MAFPDLPYISLEHPAHREVAEQDSIAFFDRRAETPKGRQAPRIAERIAVYGEDETQHRSRGSLLSWREMDRYEWLGEGAG